MQQIRARKHFQLKLIFVLTMIASGRGAAQSLPRYAGSQDIYLAFNFSGLVNTVVVAQYYNDSVFVPIANIFKELRVDYSLDIGSGIIKGFYIDPSVKYEINFRKGIARIGGREISFDTSKILTGQLDYYALPSFFETIFGLNFTVDYSSLTLVLNTNEELPIVKDYRRESRRNYMIVSPYANLEQAPLVYPMHRSLINGAVIDYSLSSYNGTGPGIYNYQLNGGAEILGGETEGSVFGTVSGTESQLYSNDFSWKYPFYSNKFISFVGLGNLNTDGLTQYGFRGGQISNQPLTVRTFFGQYQVQAKTQPDWDVEFYLNGRLVGYKRADAEGRAEFTIPLVYGTSFVQIKCYGPDGEFNETDRRLQIPFTFLPAGEVNYSASAGKLDNSDEDLASADVSFGLSDWATDKVGADYLDSPLFGKPLFYNSLYMRFGPEYMLRLDAAPQAFYRSTFNALYASQSAFDISYTRYRQNLLYNSASKLQELQADAYLPIPMGNNGFNIRISGDAQEFPNGQKSYSYSTYFSTNFSQLNASVGYLKSIMEFPGGGSFETHSITGNLLYSVFLPKGALSFLNGTLINATGRYGVLKKSLDDISIQLSRNIQRYVRVALTAERDYLNRTSTINLQIIADLPFTRSTSTAQMQGGSGWFTENLSGSVGFDSHYWKFLFNDLSWVGHSGASMRMFVDENGNGKYDPGEEVINEGKINLRQAVSSESSDDGIIREWNLLPYTQYSADVDLSTIRNPLWIPENKSFSFITDPNTYKQIDVPFFAGGIVDGYIFKSHDGKLEPIPGLILEIKSISDGKVRSVNVFNDGSFYYMGLPPGEYEARVDSTQLEILKVYSNPEVLHFTVKPSMNGDFIEGLRIVLKTPGLMPPAPKMSPQLAQKPTAHVESPAVKYLVQLGAFAALERAQSFARHIRIMTGQLVQARFDKSSGMYVVQTDSFNSEPAALERQRIFANVFGLSDAFVASTEETQHRIEYYVQLAAFESLRPLLGFVDKMKRETHISPVVRFDTIAHLFRVGVGPYRLKDQADSVLRILQFKSEYRGAFVVSEAETPK